MKLPSLALILLVLLAAVCRSAAAAEMRQRSPWKLEGGAEISGGFGATKFSDGFENGGLLTGKGDLSLRFLPNDSLRFLAGVIADGEYGPTQKFARAGCRLMSSISPARTFMLRAELTGSASEGSDTFRDSLRARLRIAADLDIVPATLLVSAGYAAESDDFYRIGGYEFRHRAWAEAALIPSVSPMAVIQAGIFGETLLTPLEIDRRSSPGGMLSADFEFNEWLAISFSGEYRYDLYESGVRAHALLIGARLRAKISENLFFFVEYGLDSNGSSAGNEAFLSQRVCAGFRVSS